ncbi:PepSY-associated TM helix domain-containing protein, partial [Acinetobacter baumannii]
DPARFDMVQQIARAGGIDSAEIEIRPPRAAQQAWVVREVDRSWPTQVDTVAIDADRMAITSRADFADFPLIAKLIRWGVDAHMGVLF